MLTKNLIRYKGRYLYIKRVEIKLFNFITYAYICLDLDKRAIEQKNYLKHALEDKLNASEIDDTIHKKGFFILISSDKLEIDKILPLYYLRQNIEQVFDYAKNNVDILPIRVHGEAIFRGYLLLSFISCIVYIYLSTFFVKTDYNANNALIIARNLKCDIYPSKILVDIPEKKIKEIEKILKIKFPKEHLLGE
jgi:hypothetical protein